MRRSKIVIEDSYSLLAMMYSRTSYSHSSSTMHGLVLARVCIICILYANYALVD